MALEIESRHFGEVVVLVPRIFHDDHGYLTETYGNVRYFSHI